MRDDLYPQFLAVIFLVAATKIIRCHSHELNDGLSLVISMNSSLLLAGSSVFTARECEDTVEYDSADGSTVFVTTDLCVFYRRLNHRKSSRNNSVLVVSRTFLLFTNFEIVL